MSEKVSEKIDASDYDDVSADAIEVEMSSATQAISSAAQDEAGQQHESAEQEQSTEDSENSPESEAGESVESDDEEWTEQEESDDSESSQSDESGSGNESSKDSQEQNTPAGNRGKKRSAQKRISQLTKKLREQERINAQLHQRLQSKDSDSADTTKRPDEDDFETYEDYVEALTEYKTLAALQSHEQSRNERELQNLQAQQKSAQQELIKLRVQEGQEKYADWQQVVQRDDLPFSKQLVGEIFHPESPCPEDVTYHLAKNPHKLQQLNNLSPSARSREIGRLEGQLLHSGQIARGNQGQTNTAPRQPSKKVSQAPSPINPVGTKAGGTPDISKMSASEYFDYMNKRESRDQF